MYGIFVSIQVKPGFGEQFKEARLGDGQGSVRDESNCLRLDICQSQEDPNRPHLYEVYADKATYIAPRKMPHYSKWRETVQPRSEGEPRQVEMDAIFPSDAGWISQKPNLVNWCPLRVSDS